MTKKIKTMRQHLTEIETKFGISGNRLAEQWGMSSSDYHGKLKKDTPPTTAWRLYFEMVKKHGL